MSQTKIVKLDPLKPDLNILREAGFVIRNGGLVIIPTETVYGIAADGSNHAALEKLYQIKNRPKEKQFSLHIFKKEIMEDMCKDVPVAAYKLADKFWPGPLTMILKSKNGSTIGMRMPDNDIALRVIALSVVPVICPSANISGKPAPVDFAEAIQDLNGLVDLAIDTGRTKLASESSIVDLTIEGFKILREGAIKKGELESLINKKVVLFVCTGNSCRSVMAKALLEKKLKEINRQDVEVLSAGIMLATGMGATRETQGVLLKEGMDVSTHHSQKITREMLNQSDLVLVMERVHEESVLRLCPEVKNRLFLLKEFANVNDNRLEIFDPIGRGLECYQDTLYIIRGAVERISKII